MHQIKHILVIFIIILIILNIYLYVNKYNSEFSKENKSNQIKDLENKIKNNNTESNNKELRLELQNNQSVMKEIDKTIEEVFSKHQEKGRYSKYNYTYIKNDNQYTVTFSPFLPRNDAIVIGAMLDIIDKIYGKHKIVDLTPKIVRRHGKNLIRFEGINYNYLFLLIKQDTGEVNSFSLWIEPK